MSDNTQLNTGSGGDVISTDDIGGSVKVQRVKVQYGVDGSATDVSDTNPMPVDDAGGSLTVDGTVSVSGTVTVGSHAVTNAGTFAVQDSAAETSLASIDTKTPALGQALAASSTPVVLTAAQVTTLTPPAAITGFATSALQGGGMPAALAAGGGLKIEGVAGGVVDPVAPASVPSHAVTNAGTFVVQENGAALTALQLIDDPVQVLGTDTYTEATSKGVTMGAVRRDADTTLVNTTNEFGPLQTDARGCLKVEAFSGETLPVSLTSTTVTGSVAVTDNSGSLTVDNGGTFVVQENGAALTSLQLIDDVVYTDDTSTHSTGTSKGVAMMAAATPTDGSVNANDFGVVAMTVDRKLHVAVMDALPAGSAAIGTVSVTSITAGANLIGDVGISGARTSGGCTPYQNLDVDETEDDVKTSAGQVYFIHAMNLSTGKRYLKFYNATAANVTVGSTTPLLTFTLPTQGDTNGAGFTLSIPNGIAFSTAICIAATTGFAVADSGAPGTNDVIVCLGYA